MKPNQQYRPHSLGPGLIGAIAGAAFYFLVAILLLEMTLGAILTDEGDPLPWACRVMSSPINLFSLVAFGCSMAMLLSRRHALRGENRAFGVPFLSADDTVLLPQDALTYRKQFRALPADQQSSILFRLLWAGLQRGRSSWSSMDVGDAIKTQAELIQGDVESQYAIVRYLAWAIPSIGFVGTVLGIGEAMGTLRPSDGESDAGAALQQAAHYLNTAFDTTFVALVLSLVLMYLLYTVQGEEDGLLVRATEWCMQRFVFRMHVS